MRSKPCWSIEPAAMATDNTDMARSEEEYGETWGWVETASSIFTKARTIFGS